MTPEAQRIAIAEACGAKWIHTHRPTKEGDVPTEQLVLTFKNEYHRMLSESMAGDRIVGRDVPAYPWDLNAMHEAEKVLIGQVGWVHYSHVLLKGNVHATAAQRAESFLRTIGKWAN